MQKLAVSIGSRPVGPLLKAMDPGGWAMDTVAFPGGELGVIYNPESAAQTGPLARTGLGPGLQRLPNGDIVAWSGLPLGRDAQIHLAAAHDLPRLAAGLDGVFAAVGWSAAEQRLYIATDFLGLQPIYVGEDGGSWIAATETKPFPYKPDPAGWGAFVSCGHPIGRASLTETAERLRPATVLTVTPPAAPGEPVTTQSSRYWTCPTGSGEPNPADVVPHLKANAEAYRRLAGNGLCLLSGGFDSRLILALLHRLDVPTRALILSHRDEDGDLDGELAATVARMTGTPLKYIHPDHDFFSSRAYLEYVWAIDAATPNLYLFIAQLAATLRGEAVWEGLIPALALSTLQQPGDGTFATFRALKCKPNEKALRIFKPGARRMLLDAFEAEFQRTRALYPDDPSGMWQWIVENRMRNRAGVNPTKVFVNHATPLMVGASQDLWNLTAGVSFERRKDHSFYLDVFRTLSPDLTRIPFDSGSTLYRGDASWLRFSYYRLRQQAWRQIARRPNLARLLAMDIHVHQPTRLLRCAALWREDDDFLDMDFLRRMESDETPDLQTSKLLFHWRATRWLHEGRLFSTFLEGHDVSDQPVPALVAEAG